MDNLSLLRAGACSTLVVSVHHRLYSTMGNLITTKRSSNKDASQAKVVSQPLRSRSTSPPLSKRASLTEIVRIDDGGKPVEFLWKHGGSHVIITGSFDNWSQSITMAKDSANDLWRKTLLLDPSSPHEFKFVVDGVWRCSLDWDTNTDSQGHVNNIIRP